MDYNWPLAISNFTLLDKIKISLFFLNPKNQWTMGKYVKKFENEMGCLVNASYSIACSSGSTANTILAMYLRDKLKADKSDRNIVILPSTTWTTSCSPWIREGFTPHFIDISLDNFGMDLLKLSSYLNENHEKIAAVFPTCLLGFNIDFNYLNSLKIKYPDIYFAIDNCENNFGEYKYGRNNQAFSNFTSTTSTYFGHEIQSVEGGFIFTHNLREAEQFLMYRNHGMVRSLGESYRFNHLYHNPLVDSKFDFYSLGNNFRNSNINAFIGLLDLKRATEYINKRKRLYKLFIDNLNHNLYHISPQTDSIPFCLPIIVKGDNKKERLEKIKQYCYYNNIETRPIISGFLGYQTAYKGFMDEKDYPNSIYLHNNGIYIGLHTKLKDKQIIELTNILNKI